MKIAICGKMASGKTTLANSIINQNDDEGTVLSLAKKVKDIGVELFFMDGKDRPLLQKIGMKMREIRADVWLDYLIQSADDWQKDNVGVVVVDDVRFKNEVKKLKDNGWTLIKLEITESLQKERLQKTYTDWKPHWDNRHDASEADVDNIPLEWFDYILDGDNLTDFKI